MVRTQVVLAWSGGKDSSLALARLQADPTIEVVALVTTITREYDRISIHGVRRAILQAQVRSIGLPLLESIIPANASNTLYEEAFAATLSELRVRWPAARHLAFGDLFLSEVRAYREALLERLGWIAVFPLWGVDTAALAREFIADGYRAILTCVDTTQLDATFAGREFDSELLTDLPAGVDPCGERGEFHTCVYQGRLLREPLSLSIGERQLRDERFEYCDLLLHAATGTL
jgi:uncharacterized protein (TIGR00290 family)